MRPFLYRPHKQNVNSTSCPVACLVSSSAPCFIHSMFFVHGSGSYSLPAYSKDAVPNALVGLPSIFLPLNILSVGASHSCI